jgi:hypothetical protein
VRSVERVGEVVWSPILRKDAHGSIPGVSSTLHIPLWTVDGDLGIVCTQSVSMSVHIREETSLQHFVWGRLNPWHHVGRGKCQLFYLVEVVGGVAVQDHAAHGQERELCLGPDFGEVERIPTELFSLLESHNL